MALLGPHLRGGIVRFCAGLRPARMHLRACTTKCLTPDRSDTLLMKRQSSSYESTSSTPVIEALNCFGEILAVRKHTVLLHQ